MPPSDSATRSVGNLWKTGDNSMSTVVNCEFIPKSAMATAKFASGAVTGRLTGAEMQAQGHVGRLGRGE